MLRFFRSSGIMVLIVIILTGILTWLHILSEPATVPSCKYGTLTYRALTGWLADLPRWYAWCRMFLLLLMLIMLIAVNNRFLLIEKFSYLPSVCFVLLIGGIPEIHLLNPAIIATILLVISFGTIAKSLETERLSYLYFTASVFISIATFFYQYMYVYMLAVWAALALYRPGHWREWVFTVLGFALPLFFAFSWFFLVDDDYTKAGVFIKEIFSINRIPPSISLPSTIFMLLCMVIGVFAALRLTQYLGTKKVIYSRRANILILISAITAGLVIIVPDTLPFAWYLLAFPMSFFIANYLANTRSFRWGNFVLLILFIAVATVRIFF